MEQWGEGLHTEEFYLVLLDPMVRPDSEMDLGLCSEYLCSCFAAVIVGCNIPFCAKICTKGSVLFSVYVIAVLQ